MTLGFQKLCKKFSEKITILNFVDEINQKSSILKLNFEKFLLFKYITTFSFEKILQDRKIKI